MSGAYDTDHCPHDNRCEVCLNRDYNQLRGAAMVRGGRWAERVARVCPRDKPWPPYEGKTADIARKWVRDMTTEPQLREMLAKACHEGAAEEWNGQYEEQMRRKG
jgi:hypothetical protein